MMDWLKKNNVYIEIDSLGHKLFIQLGISSSYTQT